MDSCAPRPVPAAGASIERERLIAEALEEGLRQHRDGDLAAAADIYGCILTADPEHPQALHLCGVIAHQQGAYDLARSLVERALVATPNFAAAHNTLGAILQATGNIAAAQRSFDCALALNPHYPDALQNYGTLHHSQGNLCAAIACFSRALEIGPRTPELLTTYAQALAADDRHEEARRLYDEALQSVPEHLPSLMGLGGSLRCLERYDEASAAFERATQIAPQSIEAWMGLGVLLLDKLGIEAAISCFDRALAIEPQHPQVRWTRALAYLTAGRLQEGWREYAWRWRSPSFDSIAREHRVPRWDGNAALAGRTVLVWREQGVADEIVFASMYADLARETGRCIIECDPRLTPLFRRSFPDLIFIATGCPPHPLTASPAIDFQAPIGDLAPRLRPTLASFPAARSHLRANPARVDHWRTVLNALGPRPKIGISWRSGNMRGVRALAGSDLAQWTVVLNAIAADWVNLQYDHCDAELDRSYAATGIEIHRFPALDMYNDFDETAALMSALDLVITAPTTVCALSAALGVPTWQLASGGADWQPLGETRVPWLPSVRRIYRPWHEDWSDVLKRVAAELSVWADSRNAAR